jgi:hypothetical protein
MVTLSKRSTQLSTVNPIRREQAKAWKRVEEVIERFKSADWYLFSLPMWNFGVPYVLKHFIDVIIQPGLTFSFSPSRGLQGLSHGEESCRGLRPRRRLRSWHRRRRLRPAEQNPWWNPRVHRSNRRYQHLCRADYRGASGD